MNQFWICFLGLIVCHCLTNIYFKNQEVRLLKDNIKFIQKSIDEDKEIINLQKKINKRIDELLNQN